MNRRALLVALGLAMVGVTILLLYMQRFERAMSGGTPIELLTVMKELAPGDTITEDVLSTRAVPQAYVEDRAVKASEKAKVLGLRTSGRLEAQQTLMWTDLSVVTQERDLSSLVQPGKRGVTVRASGAESAEANLLIHPGDYVDVILTTNEDTTSDGASTGGKVSLVLLQKVLVLAVGLDTRGSAVPGHAANADDRGERLLTLSLNLQEAQLLMLAVEKGKISVAVRNPDDPQRVIDALPDMKASALLDSKAREQVQEFRHAAAKSEGPTRIEEARR